MLPFGFEQFISYSVVARTQFRVFNEYEFAAKYDRVWSKMVIEGLSGQYTYMDFNECVEAAAAGHLLEQVIMYAYKKRKVLERPKS